MGLFNIIKRKQEKHENKENKAKINWLQNIKLKCKKKYEIFIEDKSILFYWIFLFACLSIQNTYNTDITYIELFVCVFAFAFLKLYVNWDAIHKGISDDIKSIISSLYLIIILKLFIHYFL